MTIEMDDVIIARTGVQMGTQLVKGRRAQHLHAHGQIVLSDQIQQRR